jgi:NAD(P)-dependent dehydrogenase (short-subunit alcohol dehydrogenase family)
MQVRDTVVMVTGAASGIGAAMAAEFRASGAAAVVVADRDAEGAHRVAAAIDGDAIVLDVTDEQATADVIASIESTHGRLDILCCNAGIATGGSVDAGDDEWQRTWEVNLMAHVYATRHAIPGMIERGGGYIVSTASAAGLLTNIGAAPYSVTKHAAVALAEWLAITYGDLGIGVSCLCPQFVATPMLNAFAGRTDEMRAWVEGIAIAPEEVAAMVITAIEEETFLILPHPEVATYFRNKANDYDRWIAGMRRLQASFDA